jgi:hypothetical protein
MSPDMKNCPWNNGIYSPIFTHQLLVFPDYEMEVAVYRKGWISGFPVKSSIYNLTTITFRIYCQIFLDHHHGCKPLVFLEI